MFYKGYTGEVEKQEDGTFYGRVIGIQDVITFQGKTMQDVLIEFKISVNDYLEFVTQK